MAEAQITCEICASDLQRNDVGIYAKGWPVQTSKAQVFSFFSRFDDIEDFHFGDSYCIVYFRDRNTRYALINQPVFMYGVPLTVKPKNNDRVQEMQKYADFIRSLCPDDVAMAISQKSTLESQVEELIRLLEPDENVLTKYGQVCSDLQKTLGHICSAYKVMPFGSSVNGLAFKGSDLDVFFGPESTDGKERIPDLFTQAHQAIRRCSHFKSVQPVPNARVPIIKFVHVKTGIQCDLSFRNIMGVQNSRLLKFLISLDDRVKPLFMIVKYWAKLHNLTGKRLSNYGFLLLLINFLQSLSDPILPPISDLQHVRLERLRVDKWNANFDSDITRIRPVSNNSKLEELLFGFFDSLSNSNFYDYVLSPLLGTYVYRSQFDHPKTLPSTLVRHVNADVSSLQSLKIDGPLCIQDPFELNLNVSQNLRHMDLSSVKRHSLAAAQICRQSSHSILPLLLSFRLRPFTQSNALRPPTPLSGNSDRYKVTLRMPFKNKDEDLIPSCRSLLRKVVTIFKDILALEVDGVTQDTKELNIESEENDRLNCKGYKILWLSRNYLWEKLGLGNHIDKKCDNHHALNASDDEVQVVYVGKSEEPSHLNSTKSKGKRKITDPQSELKSKKRKLDPEFVILEEDGLEKNDRISLVDLDSDESNDSHLSIRTLEEEIKLSKTMALHGHAPRALHPILVFECKIRTDETCFYIDFADHGSRSSYFHSLCSFFDKNLRQWIMEC